MLVVGGGNVGVVREVLKHKGVKRIVFCGIDEAVVHLSRQFLPHMSSVLDDPRVTVSIGDSSELLADSASTFDVVISGPSSLVHPNPLLLGKTYFDLLHGTLLQGGHISIQAKCPLTHFPLIVVSFMTDCGSFLWRNMPTRRFRSPCVSLPRLGCRTEKIFFRRWVEHFAPANW